MQHIDIVRLLRCVLEWQQQASAPACCVQKNHLSGLKRRLLKLVFWNETHMAEVRRECQALVRRNRYKAGSGIAAYDVVAGERGTRERIQARCKTLPWLIITGV